MPWLMCYTAATGTEQLTSDSADQTVSDGSDTETVDGSSEDSDNSVPTGQLWPRDSRSEERCKIHQFSAPELV